MAVTQKTPPLPGTRPEGSRDEREAAARVQEMFTHVAPRYDFLNHLLSFSLDRIWRRRTAARFAAILRRPDARVLDVCCGTGDMAFALDRLRAKLLRQRAAFDAEGENAIGAPSSGTFGGRTFSPGTPPVDPSSLGTLDGRSLPALSGVEGNSDIPARRVSGALAPEDTFAWKRAASSPAISDASPLGFSPGVPYPILGTDFVEPMLARAREKARAANQPVIFESADALHLPFADATFDLLTTAFGFRNLANYEAGLREFARVLKRDGELGILEFSEPSTGALAGIFRFYFQHILPRIGGAISGNAEAYRYLPGSVAKFPSPPELAALIERTGFAGVRITSWNFGSVVLHSARRA
jgi:ubiquinone/menaquinone biosynthesis methyltransferase